jgi:hypothetical protein
LIEKLSKINHSHPATSLLLPYLLNLAALIGRAQYDILSMHYSQIGAKA